MFSPALEVVLMVAYREATSRRHTHLTLEISFTRWRTIRTASASRGGADLPRCARIRRYLRDRVEQFTRRRNRTDARVPPR
jgi:hypothetical protein